MPSTQAKPGRSRISTGHGTSTVDRIIAYITDALRWGRLAPGQRLVESDIQAEVGASRGPVREALRKLASDGLIEIYPHKGARVKRLTRMEVVSLYDIREVLEGLAARLAAEQNNPSAFAKQIGRLEAEFDSARDGSPRTYMAYNESFHRAVLERSRNDNLIRMVEHLQVPLVMLRLYAMIDEYRIDQAHREHHGIVEAIVAGNELAAERAMRKHIRSTKMFVLEDGTHLLA